MASPSKTLLEISDQAQEFKVIFERGIEYIDYFTDQAQELKGILERGIEFVDSFTDQVRTALSQKSEPSGPPPLVNNTQANLHDGEKLKAAEASLFPASSYGSQFYQRDSAAPSSHPDSGDQAEALKNSALLGKDDSFMNQAQTTLSQKSKPFRHPAEVIDLQAFLRGGGKLKAEHVPATLIRIGSWQFASVRIADLVAKFYFTKRKLIWEMLANGLKYKMEMRFADISAIRASIEENKPGILEIELYQPPTFYKETDPKPQRATHWDLTRDFTWGRALTCRRHCLVFPPAALDENYIKLLSSDPRLLELSRSSFPSTEKTFCTLQNSGFKNSQMTHVSNNLSQSEALPPLRPAAAVNSALYLRDHLNSPDVGEAGKTQRQSVLDPDPISWFKPRPLPAINSTFTPSLGSSSAASSTNNGDAMGVQEKHDRYADGSGKSIGPSEQNITLSLSIGSMNAGGSASNGDGMGEAETMGVQEKHDKYVDDSGKSIGPSEQNTTLSLSIGSSKAGVSASNGDGMGEAEAMGVQEKHDRYADDSGKSIGPSEQNITLSLSIGSSNAGGSASNGDGMGEAET